jgi:hypothetical protein
VATKQVNIDIIAKDKTRQAMKSATGSVDKLKNSVFNLKNALVAIGAGVTLKSFVDVGRQVESLQIRLKFLFGSVEEGAKAFDVMSKFASKVPFSLEQIQAGAGNLAVVAKDAEELSKVLEITGNVASVTGLDFQTTAEQIQRSLSAGIASADIFRERGVRDLLGFKAGATVTAEETAEAFERVFGKGGRFAGATDDLAKTFTGTLSMIGDKIFNFQKVVAEGFLVGLKKEFGELDKFFQDNQEQIDKIAQSIGVGLSNAVIGFGEAVEFVADNFRIFKAFVAGFIAFKFTKVVLELASAFRQVFITLTGITALSGAKGLTLFAGAIGAITTASMLLPDPLIKAEEALKKLTSTQINRDIYQTLFAIRDLEVKNKELKESFDEIVKSGGLENNFKIDMDDITGSVMKYKDEIAKIPTLQQHIVKSMGENEAKIIQLNEKYLLLNKTFKATKAMEMEANEALGQAPFAMGGKVAEVYKKQTDAVKETTKATLSLAEADKLRLSALEAIDIALGRHESQIGLFANFANGFKEVAESQKEMFKQMQDIGASTFDRLKTSLTDFVMTGKLSFADLGTFVVRSMVDMLIGEAIKNAMKGSLAMFKAESIKKAFISLYEGAMKTFASIPFPFNVGAVGGALAFGTGLINKIRGFEKGGRPPVGRASIVGEKGAELFVPDQAGTVVPNDKLGMEKQVTVNFNINTVDARGFNELLVNSRGVIVNLINSAMNEKGRMAVI